MPIIERSLSDDKVSASVAMDSGDDKRAMNWDSRD